MSTEQHSNYIAGEWVAGATAIQNINPSDTERRRRRVRAGRRGAGRAGDRGGARGRSRPGRRRRAGSAPTSSTRSAPRSWRARTSSARLLAREEGKTLPEGIGEATRAGQIFKFFAGEALRAPAS